MREIMIGAIAMGFAVAALFFFRYWRATRDRLFGFFALSFLVLALNRVAQGAIAGEEIGSHYHLYWIRFVAFLLILVAIVDKNVSRRRSAAKP